MAAGKSGKAERAQAVPAVPGALAAVVVADRDRLAEAVAPDLTVTVTATDPSAPQDGPKRAAADTGLQPSPDDPTHWTLALSAAEPTSARAAAEIRGAAAKLVTEVRGRAVRAGAVSATVAVQLPASLSETWLHHWTLGLIVGSHRWQWKRDNALPALTFALVPQADGGTEGAEPWAAAVARAQELARATGLARDLANAPSNLKSPAWLAERAVAALGELDSVGVRVRDERWLREKGFGGVLAVGEGSVRPPRLIEVKYRPKGSASLPHLALVGKGITFDSGGLSIKPAQGMETMKTDMSGGAAVLAAIRAIAELELPLRVTGLVPAAENMPSGSAYRPGDIVTHYDGQTTEVSNTDAEGRMVLADALAFAVERWSPDLVIDVATLTGAAKVALGTRTGAVFATDPRHARTIIAAGESVGEAWWQLPLPQDLLESVKSDIADLAQSPGGPGAITAALFLSHFVGQTPWVHLDIAGPGRAEQPYAEVTPLATGFSARSLVVVAESLAQAGRAKR